MSCNIDKIFEQLSWNNSEEIQQAGIETAKEIKYLSVFIMPIENKSVWENCAKILASKTDDELKLYYFQLFEWIKDMNWPGADLIYDRLLVASGEDILSAYRYSVSIAEKINDYTWKRVLKDFYSDYIMKK